MVGAKALYHRGYRSVKKVFKENGLEFPIAPVRGDVDTFSEIIESVVEKATEPDGTHQQEDMETKDSFPDAGKPEGETVEEEIVYETQSMSEHLLAQVASQMKEVLAENRLLREDIRTLATQQNALMKAQKFLTEQNTKMVLHITKTNEMLGVLSERFTQVEGVARVRSINVDDFFPINNEKDIKVLREKIELEPLLKISVVRCGIQFICWPMDHNDLSPFF